MTSTPFYSNCNTLFEIFIFFSKNSTLKTRKNAVVLDFLAVDNFDFTRKTVKKILGEKLVKMLRFALFSC